MIYFIFFLFSSILFQILNDSMIIEWGVGKRFSKMLENKIFDSRIKNFKWIKRDQLKRWLNRLRLIRAPLSSFGFDWWIYSIRFSSPSCPFVVLLGTQKNSDQLNPRTRSSVEEMCWVRETKMNWVFLFDWTFDLFFRFSSIDLHNTVFDSDSILFL